MKKVVNKIQRVYVIFKDIYLPKTFNNPLKACLLSNNKKYIIQTLDTSCNKYIY